ncbi:MAG: MBL fold metallo-hydrolase [Clostridia bacterium]|nr:MBL fold metallo-hydrolase [Clostridia bacterium]
MRELTVTDVRPLLGDSGFLIDDGKTSILYDTGFGFTGDKLAENVKRQLGNRRLDYIFLTHSHYDHALGAVYVQKIYPEAKIVAGEYAAKIFEKPSAKSTMRRLDRKFARKCGIYEYEDLIDNLKVDIAVRDGDTVTAGDMTFTVINLPGHTKCSVGFYLAENKLLLNPETLGVYFGKNSILPICLVGYKMSLDSFKRVEELDIENMLVPHYGMLDREETRFFLENSEKVLRQTAMHVVEIFSDGGSTEDALKFFEENFYTEIIRPTYPIDAFLLNTSIMIDLIRKELLTD